MYQELGLPLPPDTAYAVSVSLPSWKANIGYEEGEEWVVSKMRTGYPRFFIHLNIADFANHIAKDFGEEGEKAMLFPSSGAAYRCKDFLHSQDPKLEQKQVRVVEVLPVEPKKPSISGENVQKKPNTRAVLYPEANFPAAKSFWQHTGEGVSSRRADRCHELYSRLHNQAEQQAEANGLERRYSAKGPKRYSKFSQQDETNSVISPKGNPAKDALNHGSNGIAEAQESARFIEERFGRNLDLSLASSAKLAVRRRIAGSLTSDVELEEAVKTRKNPSDIRKVDGFSEEDVYLFPGGMNAIYHTHRMLRIARGEMKSICFGFPYTDTLKILEKFGPGCLFYGHGSGNDLDDLEERLRKGERYLALFCEFPGNPLLKSPDLKRIRRLADEYGFAVVVDETIGNFINVHVLPHADFVVSSLTKVFSGDSNVMGGSMILNPERAYYGEMKEVLAREYEDDLWDEDAIFLERNSRDFVSRIERINANAEAICRVLSSCPQVKTVYYPLYSPTRQYYEDCRNKDGGYGGLLSVTFNSTADAIAFYDQIDVAKGPSLGTNFTLCSPYVILAHFTELEWAAKFGAETDLVRISVGLEDTNDLTRRFQKVLASLRTDT